MGMFFLLATTSKPWRPRKGLCLIRVSGDGIEPAPPGLKPSIDDIPERSRGSENPLPRTKVRGWHTLRISGFDGWRFQSPDWNATPNCVSQQSATSRRDRKTTQDP
jgi:hypothetical protein